MRRGRRPYDRLEQRVALQGDVIVAEKGGGRRHEGGVHRLERKQVVFSRTGDVVVTTAHALKKVVLVAARSTAGQRRAVLAALGAPRLGPAVHRLHDVVEGGGRPRHVRRVHRADGVDENTTVLFQEGVDDESAF